MQALVPRVSSSLGVIHEVNKLVFPQGRILSMVSVVGGPCIIHTIKDSATKLASSPRYMHQIAAPCSRKVKVIPDTGTYGPSLCNQVNRMRFSSSKRTTRDDLDDFFKYSWTGRSLLFILHVFTPILKYRKLIEDCAKDQRYQEVAKGLLLIPSAVKTMFYVAILYCGHWIKEGMQKLGKDLQADYMNLLAEMKRENMALLAEIQCNVELVQDLYNKIMKEKMKDDQEENANEKDDEKQCGSEDKKEAHQSEPPARKSSKDDENHCGFEDKKEAHQSKAPTRKSSKDDESRCGSEDKKEAHQSKAPAGKSSKDDEDQCGSEDKKEAHHSKALTGKSSKE